MKHTVNFIRIIGGPKDGDIVKTDEPWEADTDVIGHIEADDERYKLDRIENQTAILLYDGCVTNHA